MLRHKHFHQHYVTALLEKIVYGINSNHYLGLLLYYINFLIRREYTEETFKVLQKVIVKNNFLLQRRDSGYGSDFESYSSDSEEILYENYEKVNQYDANDTGLYEEIVKRITKTLINAGINIGTYKYERVETPLHWATRENNINLINFFIELGVDIEIQNKSGATALHMAAINDNFNIITELTKQKSNQELKALIEQGLSKELLKQRLKTNIKDNKGNTPLFFAVSCENYEIVKSLLAAGADPNVFCPLGDDFYIKTPELQNITCTPLHLAALIGNFGLINLLIEYGADINAVCKNKKYSCLHMAVLGVTCYYDEGISEEKEEEYLTVVESLISQFSNHINNQDHEYNSPLHRAVSTRHEETIRILLDHGASTLVFRRGGYTAFHDAVSIGSLALVKLLLESSDEREKVINAVYRPVEENGDDICFQFSPLHMAINTYIDFLKRKEDSLESFNIIKYLLSYSTLDHNIQDLQGKTPLHYAVEDIKEDQSALILINELLTANDINPFIRDCLGKTPIDYAKEGNRSKILQAFIDHQYGSDKDNLLHLAVSNGDSEAVDYLIKKGIDANLRNTSYHTPLHLASGNGYVDVIKILVTEGKANLNVFDARNHSPIHFAINNKQLNVVKLLFELGADINIVSTGKNSTRLSPLHVAVSSSNDDKKNPCFGIVEYLINISHCKINSQDYQSQTPLHYAIDEHKLNIVAVLLTKKDINPFSKDAENKTPIDYYIEQKKYNHPILDQYAEIQEERNAKIRSYQVKKYFVYTLTLCAINSAFAGIYTSLGNIALDISLVLIINIAALACCLIINKCVERAIEEKFKNKASDLFNGYIQAEEQLNHVIENCSDLPIPSKLDCINKQSFSQREIL
ncbi:ankyrin repeat domain-containing protein [Candidatus Mesenet endosymbiont of Phosphuga atrata]|uniref:ankyrin repeat domain-containing protein n=1 Tax=Candidatus Mesenet endosymbiont of Phosphuga atrata TaxID=3066221 RepID=UPI0030CEA014